MLEVGETSDKNTTIMKPEETVKAPSSRKMLWGIILIVVTFGSVSGFMGYICWNLNNKYNSLQFEYATLQGIHS